MCWIDKDCIKQTLQLKNDFKISTFVETGVFKGVNAQLYANYFKEVFSCDIVDEYIEIAKNRNINHKNVFIYKESSPNFLNRFINDYYRDGREDIIFFFLDAHFYDPKLPPDEKWVVKNELKSLKGFKNGIICIHDFDCEGLGHCCYNGEDLGFELVLDDLMKVNSNFCLYTNNKEFCDIQDLASIQKMTEIYPIDEHILDNVKYTHSCERLTYRGYLYATPSPIDLNKYKLIKANIND